MVSKKKWLVLGLSCLLAASAFARDVLIDVRSEQEFQSGHIQTAMNTSIGEDILKSPINKDDHIIVYCKSGRRADLALSTLKTLGYTNVENYGGLPQAQSRLNLPIHTDH